MVGNEGDSLERADLPHYYSDDHLWSVLAVCSYVKEPGILDFWKKTSRFMKKN